MMASSPSVPTKQAAADKPKAALLDRIQKAAQRFAAAFKVRLEESKRAFACELAWQTARRQMTVKERATQAEVLAGVAIDPESGDCLALQEGLNVFGNECLRVEQSCATSMGGQSVTLWSGDRVKIGNRSYVLKLFSSPQFSRRATVKEGVPQ